MTLLLSDPPDRLWPDPGGLLSPGHPPSTGYPIALEGPMLEHMHAGPWLALHQNFASYVLHRLKYCDGLRNNVIELSKQWAEWDVLTSLANYQYVVDMLFKCLEVIKSSPQSGPAIAEEISQQMSRDVAMVLSQMVSVLDNKETYKQFLTCRGTLAQQLLDLVQDLLDFFCDSASRPLLSTALLRLSRASGLHPTCFAISGLEKIGHQVAGGGFGDVWKSVVDGQTVAVKSVRIFQDADVKIALKEFGREAVIWRQLSHPNLLPFFGLYYLDTRLCLVSPWMEHGHLLQFLRNAPSNIDRVSVILDVARGLEYLHSNKVVHGDLKAMNILVAPSTRACIADFGLSSIADVLPLDFTHSTPILRGGTVRYQAPELLSGTCSIHFGSDVYAFACVCYEILTGKAPFFDLANEMAVAINVINGKRPSKPETFSRENIWVLIQDCWKQEPDQRPTMTEVFQRLTSPGAESMQSEIDWDEIYSARFRRSVRPWPLLPSVTQIESRISANEVMSVSPPYFYSTEQIEGNGRTASLLAFAKIHHLLAKFPGRQLRRTVEQYSLGKFPGAETLPVPISAPSNSPKKMSVVVVISVVMGLSLSVILCNIIDLNVSGAWYLVFAAICTYAIHYMDKTIERSDF
ncbi:kinase-like domain-containing protein [Mycena epipterygia]|nr:kinase-like domain-containing protein [Mycena epipterygia]